MEGGNITHKTIKTVSNINNIGRSTHNRCEKCGANNIYTGKGFDCGKLIQSGGARYCPKCGHIWAITEEYYPRENPRSLLPVIKKRIQKNPQKFLNEIEIVDGACPKCKSSIMRCRMEVDLNTPKILYTFEVCTNQTCNWPGKCKKEYEKEFD